MNLDGHPFLGLFQALIDSVLVMPVNGSHQTDHDVAVVVVCCCLGVVQIQDIGHLFAVDCCWWSDHRLVIPDLGPELN